MGFRLRAVSGHFLSLYSYQAARCDSILTRDQDMTAFLPL